MGLGSSVDESSSGCSFYDDEYQSDEPSESYGTTFEKSCPPSAITQKEEEEEAKLCRDVDASRTNSDKAATEVDSSINDCSGVTSAEEEDMQSNKNGLEVGNGEPVEAIRNAGSAESTKAPLPAQKQPNSQEQPDSKPTISAAGPPMNAESEAPQNTSTQPRRAWKPVERSLAELQRGASQLRTTRLPNHMQQRAVPDFRRPFGHTFNQ